MLKLRLLVKGESYTLGLIGYPLEHSLSPRLHTAALGALDLAGEYRLYLVPPLPDGSTTLKTLLNRMRQGEVHGLNVTIPHKQMVIPLLDDLTPTARAIEAVNTIFRQGESLIGDNTDAPGFLTALERFTSEVASGERGTINQEKCALILGAGGASRAVVHALVQRGWQIYVAARHLEQAQELVRRHVLSTARRDNDQVVAMWLNPSSIRSIKSKVSLIVNSTPLGMMPHVQSTPWPSETPFPPGAAVYDLVYNPPETALVRAARHAGLPATTGLGMLVEQAALAFERWTGHIAPRQTMWSAVKR